MDEMQTAAAMPEKKKSPLKHIKPWTAAAAAILAALFIIPVFIFTSDNIPVFFEPTDGPAETTPFSTTRAATTRPPPREPLGTPAKRFEIVPVSDTPEGVAVNSQFLIKTTAPIEAYTLRNQISAAIPIHSVWKSANSDYEFVLTFGMPLKYDTVYTIEYTGGERPLSFAFQTMPGICVESHTPGHNASGVPFNSGIEVTFNEKIDGNFADYFKIEPAVDGRFENLGNTYIFIPELLSAGTTYKVTVSAKLTGADSGKALGADYTFSFLTQYRYSQGAKDNVSLRQRCETFLTGDDLIIELYAYGAYLKSNYSVEIYTLSSPDKYLQWPAVQPFKLSDADLKFLEAFETVLLVINNDYIDYSYILPEKSYPAGWYAAKIKSEAAGTETLMEFIFQYSPLSVYCASLGGETLVWVNDTEKGVPAQGAAVSFDGRSGVTGSDGTVVLPARQSGEIGTLVKIKYGGYPEFTFNTHMYNAAVPYPAQRYYSYIYTDRKVYRPNDTVDIFGVVKPRYANYPVEGANLTLKIDGMNEIKLTPDSYGTFMARIPVTDMKGYATLSLCLNGQAINETWINFIDYDNDAYLAVIKTDRASYRPGDTVDIEVAVTTYDGTPAEGVDIRSYNNNTEIRGTTGPDGKAAISETISVSSIYNRWQPYYNSYYYNIGNNENKYQFINTSFIFVPSDIMLEHEVLPNSTVEFKANAIKTEMFEKKSALGGYYNSIPGPDEYRGDPADVEIRLEITRYESKRIKTGDRYDFINKVNVPIYTYETKSEQYKTITLKTVNGKALAGNLPLPERVGDSYFYYSAQAYYKDTAGNEISIGVNLLSERNPFARSDFQSSIKNFTLVMDDGNSVFMGEYGFERSGNRLKLGESANIKLYQDYGYRKYYYYGYVLPEPTAVTEGQILTVLCRDSIIETKIGSPEGTSVTFTQDCIYNARVVGAYFDGRYVYPAEGFEIVYDYSEKNLDIEITFDKEDYLPGEKVTAKIKAVDAKGNPVSAKLNVSVVDESALADYWHGPNILARFYSSPNLYITYTHYVSYTQHEFGNGGNAAEMGGGGDDFFTRRNFVDNPAFLSAQTGADGMAEVVFTLGDKVTSWRVTVHGFTADNYAGDMKQNIISTLPFSVDTVMAKEFIVGDDITVSVKPFGKAFSLGFTEVKYEVSILQGDEKIASVAGTSTGIYTFNAGRLPEGEYTVRVSARTASGLADGLEKPFAVVKEGLLLPLVANDIISAEKPALPEYKVSASPVKVTMYNAETAFLMRALSSCVGRNSNRTDNMAAKIFSDSYMIYFRNNNPFNPSGLYYGFLYDGGGGIPELRYGSPDLLYTARFFACFPNTARAQQYRSDREYIKSAGGLYSSGRDVTPESASTRQEMNRAAAYYALAAMGDPVLLEIYKQLGIIESSPDQAKFTDTYEGYMRVLCYASALCALGDDYGASGLLSNYKPSAKIFDSADSGAEAGMRSEYIAAMTLYLNTRLDPDAAYKYMKEERKNLYVSDVCERVNFIAKFKFGAGSESSIRYTDDFGNTKFEHFSGFRYLGLTLSKELYRNLNVTYRSGRTAVQSTFYGPPENLKEENNVIPIKKYVLTAAEFARKTGTPLNKDDAVRYIVFDIKIPEGEAGYYTVRDRAPSNTRFIRSYIPSAEGKEFYFSVNNPEKQTVDVSFYSDGGKEVTVWYTALSVSGGYALPGKAYVSAGFDVNGIWGRSE